MERRIRIDAPENDYVSSLLDAAKITQTVLQACELQLFDELSLKPTSVNDLAERKKWEPDALRRLMDTMVAVKLLKKPNGVDYEVSEFGKLLIKNGPPALYEYSMMVKDDVKGIGGIAETIKKGPRESGSGETTGEPSQTEGGDYGTELQDGGYGMELSPEFWLNIYRMSEGVSGPYADGVAKTFDLSKFKTAVDLGGGSGVFSYALLRAYPQMRVTLAELAVAIPTINENFVSKNKDPRLDLKAVDYKKDELPKADLYVIGNVIHDHEPEPAKALLTKINQALNPGGGILIIDQLLNDGRDGPPMPHTWDLAFCGWGRMYSGKDLKAFLQASNFSDVQVVRTQDASNCDMVFAIKK